MIDGDCLTDADISSLTGEELLRLYAAVMGEMMARREAARPEQWGPPEDSPFAPSGEQ